MKTISRVSILTMAPLHGGLFHFLLNVNSNFGKKAEECRCQRVREHVLLDGFFPSHSLNVWETPREAQHNGANEKPLIIPICSQRYVQHNQFFMASATLQRFAPRERGSEPAAAGDRPRRR